MLLEDYEAASLFRRPSLCGAHARSLGRHVDIPTLVAWLHRRPPVRSSSVNELKSVEGRRAVCPGLTTPSADVQQPSRPSSPQVIAVASYWGQSGIECAAHGTSAPLRQFSVGWCLLSDVPLLLRIDYDKAWEESTTPPPNATLSAFASLLTDSWSNDCATCLSGCTCAIAVHVGPCRRSCAPGIFPSWTAAGPCQCCVGTPQKVSCPAAGFLEDKKSQNLGDWAVI